MKTPLRALVIEDSVDDARLLERELKQGGFDPVCHRIETAGQLEQALKSEQWDIVLCDYKLPGFSGLEALRMLNGFPLDLPFIFVSGTMGEDVAVNAMKAGAHDYVMKSNLARLVPAIKRELRDAQERRQRREAERTLRESEDMMRRLAETAADAIIMMDSTGRVLYWNPAAEKIFGYAAHEVLGHDMHEFLLPRRDYAAYEQGWQRFRKTGTGPVLGRSRELQALCKGGREIPVELSVALISIGGEVGALGIARDVSERKRAEAEKERLVRDKLLILESTTQGLYGLDLEGRCTFMNRAAGQMLGYSVDDVVGRKMHDLVHAHEEHDSAAPGVCPILEVMKSGQVCRSDSDRFSHKNGKVFPVEYSASPIWENGKVSGAVVAFSDLTEKRELEARFLRAQRLESIGQLAGGIAHDLNNILVPMLMCAPLLREEVKSDAGRSILRTLEASAQRGADIVKQVLTFAKGVGGQRIPIQPRHLVKEVGRFIRETFPKSIKLVEVLPPDIWNFPGDTTQIHQVLLNLTVNARDAMPNGGTLTIALANAELDEAAARALPGAKPGPYVVIKVGDTGTGIPPEIAERIFDPFFTTKGAEKGTGLGLSTVLGIVKSHGGAIHFTSKAGHGTEFMIYLPATALAVSAPKPGNHDSKWQGRGQLVLVIDDEESVVSMIKMNLESNGYRTVTAASGEEALKVYGQRSAEVDLVLTDIDMPGMSGPAMIAALRERRPNIRIVISTASEKTESVQRTNGAPAIRVLRKPFDSNSLLVTLGTAFAEQPGSAPVAG